MEELGVGNVFVEDEGYLLERKFLLRNYQLNLLKKAKDQNSVIYLPTGSGKTLIAIHVLQSRAEEIKKPLSAGGKRAIFITTTKVMAHQIAQNILTSTKFQTVFLTGDLNIDSWEKDTWQKLLEKNHVIILTAEILNICLKLQFIIPSIISLLVIDECHHAVRDHPYSSVLQSITKSESEEKPLILGLTSVLLSTTPKLNQVRQCVKDLEILMNAKVVTESDLQEIMSFAANPVEKIILHKKNSIIPEGENILKMYDNLIETLDKMAVKSDDSFYVPENSKYYNSKFLSKRMRNLVVKSKNIVKDLGFFCGSLSALLVIISLEKMRLLSNNLTEVQILMYATTEVIKLRRAFQKLMGEEESVTSIIHFSSDKVRQLLLVLKKEGSHNEKFAGLIFVQQRMTAVVLTYLLKRLKVASDEYSFLKPEFVIGSTNFNKESMFLEFTNEEIINKFSSQVYNILIATNILEEGLDVPVCNVVLMYDFPLNYTSYFQSRGRARNKEGFYYIFIADDEVEKKTDAIQCFKEIENELQKITAGEFSENDASSTSSATCTEEMLLVKKSGTVLIDGITAIKIVYRYCGKLCKDKFSLLSPISWCTSFNNTKKGFVQLPMSCPIREVIEGEPRSLIRAAKRSAFLHAVKMLYDRDELDEYFNPKSFSEKENTFKYLFPHFKEEEIDKSMPQPGSRKNTRKYKMKFAESLSGCLPSPGKKTFLHVINLTIDFDVPPIKRKVAIYETLRTPVTFALLTSKKLFKILRFPVYLDMGPINCDLLVNYDEVVLTEDDLNSIKQCHFALFHKVVKVLKNFQVFDNRNKEHSFFVVPVEKNEEDRFKINWNLIQCDYFKDTTSALVRYNPSLNKSRKMSNSHYNANTIDSIEDHLIWGFNQECDEQERSKFAMTETDYKHFIISPSYRNQEFPQHYIVDKVCFDMSPLSPFPREIYEDYIEYYKKNYMIEITDEKQPLLKVSPIYNCRNFNKPRKRNLAKEKFKSYCEHLIPELCDVIRFDRKYFLKALLLPTVLNRIYHVYCVEEFRRKLVSEVGLGTCELPEGTNWAPLESVADLTLSEDCEERNNLNVKDIKLLLPLAKLKDQTKANKKVLLDPERHMTETGVCDIEFFTSSLNEMLQKQDLAYEAQLKGSEEEIKVQELQNIAIPPLKFINEETTNNLGPDLAQLIQACTATSANDMINYERLEILGDSFLKFSTTLFLFKNFNETEGFLSALKGKIVGNRNLYYCALAKGFTDVINTNDFAPLFDWNPPLICVPEKLMDEIVANNLDPAVIYRFEIPPEERFSGVLSTDSFQKCEELFKDYETCYTLSSNSLFPYKVISDKVVSDCVEAFIGVYLLGLGLRKTFTFLSWLGVLPSTNDLFFKLVKEPHEDTLTPEAHMNVMHLLSQAFYSELENTLNYTFKNKALLLEAITHPSYQANRITQCYQKLEMLGDAVLDFLITCYIYEYGGNLTPGEVTDLRSSLVNNTTFACLSVRYEFHKHLLYLSWPLKKDINNFVQFQKARNDVVDDSVLILLENNDYSLVESVSVPKALGDVFESLAGAIFLDSGNSLEAVWEVFYVLMKREIDEFSQNVPKTPVRLLHDITSCKPVFESKVVQENSVMVGCVVYFDGKEVKGYGFGRNKKEAKLSASKAILNKILAPKNDSVM